MTGCSCNVGNSCALPPTLLKAKKSSKKPDNQKKARIKKEKERKDRKEKEIKEKKARRSEEKSRAR